MTLHDTIIADASLVFCNPSDFAEEVTYQPYGGGSARPINAVVIREPDGSFGNDEQSELPRLVVNVENSATTGISSGELREGRDKILVAVRSGGTPEPRTITNLLSHDEGMLELECR